MKTIGIAIAILWLYTTTSITKAQTPAFTGKIQMVLAKSYHPNFDEASKYAIDEIQDGEPLWLYIKSSKPFKEIVSVNRIPQSDGSVLKKTTLLLRLGPNNDWAPYNDYCEVCFGNGKECAYMDRVSPEMLEKTELILNLTTYDPKGSSKVMLSTVGRGSPGNWDNQVRLYVADKQVAVARLNCKVEDGVAKYRKMWQVYEEKMSQGDESSNELPQASTYKEASLENEILQFARQKNIQPDKIYFTMDGWTEVEESSIERFRYIVAALVYHQGDKCYYGIVRVRQDYAFAYAKYGSSVFGLEDVDKPVNCQ